MIREDKDPAIPYLSHEDFDGLKQEADSFINPLGKRIAFFWYHYDNYIKDKVIVFLHGIGPGHTAYIREIEKICKEGYRVLTFDYLGCGESEGEWVISSNQPTKDLISLLEHLSLKEEVILIGHSMGAYTALNAINKLSFVKKAVIMSGFLEIKDVLQNALKLNIFTLSVTSYEKHLNPHLLDVDNKTYLKNTTDKLLFIHSKDDPIVGYKYTIDVINKFNNPNIETLTVLDRHHNPNYTKDAVDYMNQTIGTYLTLMKKKKLQTIEERKEYFADKSLMRMTEQDDEVFKKIFEFIK